jgi:restriction system protein
MEDTSHLEYIDVRSMQLQDWLALVNDPPPGKCFIRAAFPTDEHREEYIATIGQRSEEEVCHLLYIFLIKSGSLGLHDEFALGDLIGAQEQDPERFQRMIRRQYFQRLVRYAAGESDIQPWEGNTWILDLLPHSPKSALEALNAYTLAHIQLLPDTRLNGLWDASEVIRAKFIGMPGSQAETTQFFQDLPSRHLECLIERLYAKMGYETILTPPQKDGGRDIIAQRQKPGELEHLLIECKRYSEPVGVKIIRALYGVVSDEKVNKGVLVTTSRFTEDAMRFAVRNPRLELIAGGQLVLLLNEHLGPKWSLHIERLVTESERKYREPRANAVSEG